MHSCSNSKRDPCIVKAMQFISQAASIAAISSKSEGSTTLSIISLKVACIFDCNLYPTVETGRN